MHKYLFADKFGFDLSDREDCTGGNSVLLGCFISILYHNDVTCLVDNCFITCCLILTLVYTVYIRYIQDTLFGPL